MSENSRNVIVAGGGIAGLAAALCLAAKGLRVDVFEQAEAFETVGAGLQISPNAFHILEGLGLGRAIKSVATAPSAIKIMSAGSGREIVQIPLGAGAIERYGAPYLVIHRADLQKVLSSAANENPDIVLHMGKRVEDVALHANGVTCLVYGKERVDEYAGLAMVAADGVWSRMRTLYFDDSEAKFTGLAAWRGLVPMEALADWPDRENVQLWLASNAHAVSYPVRQGRYLNFVAVTKMAAPNGKPKQSFVQEGEPDELAGELRGWDKRLLTLLQHRSRWTKWPLFAVPQMPEWNFGAMALIGDAAHAMLPFAAQGAAMAIEDAAVLANCLAPAVESRDGGAALARYSQERQARVQRAARLAQQNWSIYHMQPPLSTARDVSMALLGGRRLLGRQDWLYGWKAQ
jgi:2-polyprenyl-6-methoxyphenol hydroxylase-like FAD-dependent oxidoreductase